MVKLGPELRGVNQGWHFELTVLPEEILDFLPWIVSLVKAQSKGSPLVVQSPPQPLEFVVPAVGLFDNAWTEKAWIQGDAKNGTVNRKKEKLTNINRKFEAKAS